MSGNDVDRLIEQVRQEGDGDRPARQHDEMRSVMTALRHAFRAHDDAALLGHPHAQYLELVARDGIEGLPAGLGWVAEHLEDCAACADSVRVAGTTLLEPEPRRSAVGAWSRFTAVVLHPALAAVYLIGVVVLGTWIGVDRTRPGDPPTLGHVPTPQLVFSDPLMRSGPAAAAVLELPRSVLLASDVHLVLQTDRDGLDDPARRYRLSLTASSGEVVWQLGLEGTAFSPLGMASVLVPSRLLRAEGTYDLVLQAAPDGPTLLERRLGFVE